MKTFFLCLTVLSVLTSCMAMTQRVYVDGTTPAEPEEATYSVSQPFFILGFEQQEAINAKEICKDKGISEITSYQTFLETVIGFVTCGIYAPRTIMIKCN